MSAAPPDPQLWRALPAVHRLQHGEAWAGVKAPDSVRATIAREVLEDARQAIASGAVATPDSLERHWNQALASRVALVAAPSLRPVLNGSGVLLHTNSGRAPLPASVRAHLDAVTAGYNSLELEPGSGRRGSRQDHCRPLLRWLTGAEDALVVNNGAAAILLVLQALARGRPVVVSRGELVEIGGGFRVPDIMATSGAQLVEVGTTNRTHLRDYEQALQRLAAAGTPVAAVLRVHRSNFAVVGFEAQPNLDDLAALARRHGVQTWVDLGSGALQPLPVQPARLPDGSQPPAEPTVAETLASGADVVTFSGDKLLGGPQAGIVAGRAQAIAQCGRDPLARALRVGSLVLAALEGVLRLHLTDSPSALPVLAQMHTPVAQVQAAAQAIAASLRPLVPHLEVAVTASVAQAGGGTHPLLVLESRSLALCWPAGGAAALAALALRAPQPLLGRVRGDALLVDVRSLVAGAAAASPPQLATALAAALTPP